MEKKRFLQARYHLHPAFCVQDALPPSVCPISVKLSSRFLEARVQRVPLRVPRFFFPLVRMVPSFIGGNTFFPRPSQSSCCHSPPNSRPSVPFASSFSSLRRKRGSSRLSSQKSTPLNLVSDFAGTGAGLEQGVQVAINFPTLPFFFFLLPQATAFASEGFLFSCFSITSGFSLI